MLKIIIILVLGFWLVRTILRGLLAGLFGPAQQRNFQQQQQQQHQQRRTGDIHVNQTSRQSRRNKTSDDFKGGDYIDYEEVD